MKSNSTSRKRSKKYNPNKLTPAQVQAKQRMAELRREAAQEYEFSMSFVSIDIRDFLEKKKIEEAELLERFPNRLTIPYHFSIAAYDYQDLAIVQVLEHVEECDQWNVELTITMSDRTDEYEGQLKVIQPFTAPKMNYFEFSEGKEDCYVDLGEGLRRKGWKGLNAEILRALEQNKNIPDGFGIDLIEVKLSTSSKFKSVSAYREFLSVAEWVNRGVAEEKLRQLWIADQIIGNGKSIGFGDVA
ncbi:hypothetical protein [Acinetobacter baumannii]|uniref:hypothetical protein n=1 Tax=Acinetobacter baumannii TaxID=470 RepID=UPI0002CEEAAD|nr:hypothetical protein [Acinetobacter baumannii]ENU55578.1 hypothetical protein F982_00752 [Acinetobacter baumannii NIPH 1362]MDN8142578.1 hypothetical protein [Acinetobacter baumannii]MDN8148343.1 hypothetical protein [Acinetobacter baumannii]MDN8155929.1 hypothetical protein [Acinetobacter baumannii]MDN8160154.1 hypothetical protein [Acinetobacter baumannii]